MKQLDSYNIDPKREGAKQGELCPILLCPKVLAQCLQSVQGLIYIY